MTLICYSCVFPTLSADSTILVSNFAAIILRIYLETLNTQMQSWQCSSNFEGIKVSENEALTTQRHRQFGHKTQKEGTKKNTTQKAKKMKTWTPQRKKKQKKSKKNKTRR